MLVVGGTEQSGKTTVASRAAAVLGVGAITSSAVLNAPAEQRLGLRPGTIAAARALSHGAYRDELVREGDLMRARGESPGAACLAAGYRVIDGMRTAKEVAQTRAAAKKLGLTSVVLFVVNPRKPAASDNTQSEALRELADLVIVNDGSLEALLRRADEALREIIN